MANGTSFCGFFSSSDALLGSSKPSTLKIRMGAAARNTVQVGENAPAPKPCKPCWMA